MVLNLQVANALIPKGSSFFCFCFVTSIRLIRVTVTQVVWAEDDRRPVTGHNYNNRFFGKSQWSIDVIVFCIYAPEQQ